MSSVTQCALLVMGLIAWLVVGQLFHDLLTRNRRPELWPLVLYCFITAAIIALVGAL